jgi:photosystem II stability/assembly factor-like uncharacterized protein
MNIKVFLLFAGGITSAAFAGIAPTNWSAVACSSDGFKVIGTVSGTSPSGIPLPGSIYTTTNSGLNWNLSTAPSLPWATVACSADGSILTAGAMEIGQPIFRSTNSGLTWFASGSPVTNQWISVASSANGVILAASYPGGGHVPGGVFISTNGGTNWTQPLHDYYSWPSVACSADGQVVVASTRFSSPGLYRSEDSGQSWTATESPVGDPIYCVRLSGDGSKLVAAGSSGHIYNSTNLGETWQDITPATNSRALIACSADAKTIIAAYGVNDPASPTLPGPSFVSSNGGVTWSQTLGFDANWAAVACSADGHRLFAADFNGWVSVIQLKPDGLQLTMPPPQLLIRNASNAVVIDWLVPSKSFALEETPSLTNPSWTATVVTPSLNPTNLHFEVLPSSVSGARFYRLAPRP